MQLRFGSSKIDTLYIVFRGGGGGVGNFYMVSVFSQKTNEKLRRLEFHFREKFHVEIGILYFDPFDRVIVISFVFCGI